MTSGFVYWHCLDCQFDCVLLADFPGEPVCPLCAEDHGALVPLHRADIPEGCEHVEGFDARKRPSKDE
jgi:hypothetical protein